MANPGPPAGTRVLQEAAGHTILGAVTFLLLLSVALILHRSVHFLIIVGWIEDGSFFAWMVRGAEFAVLLSDLVLLVAILWKVTSRAIRAI